MQEQKKPITKMEMAVLSSLSESYTLLPFMIFSSLLSGEAYTVNFFVPVLILYSIERACIIGLRGFGEINNPYRIMKDGLFMALLGGVLMILSYLYRPLLVVSALLVGVGLAPMRAMFIPLFSKMVEENPSLKKGKTLGLIMYLVMMMFVMVLRNNSLPIIPILFLIYLAYIVWIVLKIDGNGIYQDRKAFDKSKKNPVFFIFGVLALLSLLISRQYQMSGVSVLMWLTPVTVLAFFAIELYRRRKYKDYTFQTYWVGGIKSFIMLYSLVYHTSVGNTSMAMMVYLAIAFSGIVSDVVRKIMTKKMKENELSNLCLILSSLFVFLLTLPSKALNIVGIILSSTFANILVSEVNVNYMKDQRYKTEERALVKTRLQTAGSIMEQLVLFFTIYIVGETGIHINLLEPYVNGTPNPEISLILRATGLICSLMLLIIAILIVCLAGKRRKN